MSRKQKLDPLYDLTPITVDAATDAPHDEGEVVLDRNGERIYVGLDIVRPAGTSPLAGFKWKRKTGVVARLYRQKGIKSPASSCDVTVELHSGFYVWADQCERKR
ncbi:MAG: hypothetical protein ACYS7Y_29895 [Planctomycetota bacterium]|jgi:hypothetical protein